jgi:hypothetical protein
MPPLRMPSAPSPLRFDTFGSLQAFTEVVQSWPAKRLLAIWSSLPDVHPIRKFQIATPPSPASGSGCRDSPPSPRRSQHRPPSPKPRATLKVAHRRPKPRRPGARRPTRPAPPSNGNGLTSRPPHRKPRHRAQAARWPGWWPCCAARTAPPCRDCAGHGLAEAYCRRLHGGCYDQFIVQLLGWFRRWQITLPKSPKPSAKASSDPRTRLLRRGEYWKAEAHAIGLICAGETPKQRAARRERILMPLLKKAGITSDEAWAERAGTSIVKQLGS